MSDNRMIIKHDSCEDLDGRIEALSKEIEHLKFLKEHLDTPSSSQEVRDMAEVLHEHLCGQNHIDGCDWYYGPSWSKPSSPHRDYVNRAKAVIAVLEDADVARLNNVVIDYAEFVDNLLLAARKA